MVMANKVDMTHMDTGTFSTPSLTAADISSSISISTTTTTTTSLTTFGTDDKLLLDPNARSRSDMFVHENDRVESYKMALDRGMERLNDTLVEDFISMIDTFLEEYFSPKFLAQMFALYPCHQSVRSLALHLIRRQCRNQHSELLDFITQYNRRKLQEVL